jgi:hypothetical protein
MNYIDIDDKSLVNSDSLALRLRAAPFPLVGAAPALAPLHLCPELQSKRRSAIRRCAYYRWAYRGCQPGREIDDWLAAEADVNRLFGRRDRLIRDDAYFRWLRRGRAPNHEVDDWLAAERDIDAILKI